MIRYERIVQADSELINDIDQLNQIEDIFNFGNMEEGQRLNNPWLRFIENDNTLGYGWIDRTEDFEVSFFVNEKYRGNSVSKIILKELEKFGVAEKQPKITAIVKSTNPNKNIIISILYDSGYKSIYGNTKEKAISHTDNFGSYRSIDLYLEKILN